MMHAGRHLARKQIPLGSVLRYPCADCGAAMVLKAGPRGYFYGCVACYSIHRAHFDGHPHGRPADRETRKLRHQTHELFDCLWRSGQMSRNDAYQWMRKILRIKRDDCHIGLFTKEQCLKIIAEFK